MLKFPRQSPKNAELIEELGVRTALTKSILIRSFEGVVIPYSSPSWYLELANIPITREMNKTPLKVDIEVWKRNTSDASNEASLYTEKIRRMVNDSSFRPNAPSDCSKLIFDKLGYPVIRRTKKGAPSLDAEALGVLARMGSEEAEAIIKARKAMSILGQLRKWEPYAVEGHVQPKWNQFGTPHGRYTAEDPNIQNRILEIRETVVSHDGYSFVSVDLKRAEFTTWAILSGDEKMMELIFLGEDPYQKLGDFIMERAPDLDLGGESVRDMGKTQALAQLYLQKPSTMAKTKGLAYEDVDRIYGLVKEFSPEAMAYRDEYIKYVKRAARAETFWGRYRQFSDLKKAALPKSKLDDLIKTAWHHHNAGTTAEYMKIKACFLEQAIREEGLTPGDLRVAINMHDELILEVKERLIPRVVSLVKDVFAQEVSGFTSIPFLVKEGKSWLEVSK